MSSCHQTSSLAENLESRIVSFSVAPSSLNKEEALTALCYLFSIYIPMREERFGGFSASSSQI